MLLVDEREPCSVNGLEHGCQGPGEGGRHGVGELFDLVPVEEREDDLQVSPGRRPGEWLEIRPVPADGPWWLAPSRLGPTA